MQSFRTYLEGKKSNKILFMRFGGLSPVLQRGYKKTKNSPTFHSPPAAKGIYAFVWPYIEPFLLDTIDDIETRRLSPKYQYLKDPKGNKISNKTHPKLFDKLVNRNSALTFSPTQQAAMVAAQKDPDNENLQKSTYYDNHEHFLVQKVKPRLFSYTGDIWHHLKLTTPPGQIKAERGGWVKTNFEAYKEALRKELHIMKREPTSRDHLEVFIERL